MGFESESGGLEFELAVVERRGMGFEFESEFGRGSQCQVRPFVSCYDSCGVPELIRQVNFQRSTSVGVLTGLSGRDHSGILKAFESELCSGGLCITSI